MRHDKTHRRPPATSPTPPALQRPTLTILWAVALLSATVLGFEVALTRVFAVLLRYHFAFLIISIALCGLGVGGYLAYWLRRRMTLSLSRLALLFGAGILVSLFLILRVLFAYSPNAYWLAALLVLVPFTCAGAFLAEAFTRFSNWSGLLYAWDLAGAAVAAVVVIGLLQLVSAIDACLLLAVLAALVGFITLEPARPARMRSVYLFWCLAFSAVFLANLSLRIFDIPPIPPQLDSENVSLADKGLTQPLFTELGTPGHPSRIIDTRWNAFARTDVVNEAPGYHLIYTNGNVPTNMLAWDGNVAAIPPLTAQFPLSDYVFATAPLGGSGNVLSIGPGGGLDALLAVQYGAARFDGAEINPTIVRLMHDYRAYNGGIYERPDVRVVTAEGRAFVREQVAGKQQYALIFSALTKTATAGQGMALLESYIHTQDAVSDYLDALQPDGQLVWLVDNPSLLARFFTTAVAELGRRGVGERDACGHLALMYDPNPGPYRFSLTLQKSPITRTQAEAMAHAMEQRKLQVVWLPHLNIGADPYLAVANGTKTLAGFTQFFRVLDPPIDVTPCTDNHPFVLDISPGVLPIFQQLALLAALLAVVLAVMGWRAVGSGEMAAFTASDVRFLLYFLALGVGFMLVEIPLVQKLILPLGYPTLALTVILFSLLLGGGLGSWVSQRFAGRALRRWATAGALGVAAVTLACIPLLQTLHIALVTLPLAVRCLAVAGLLLPLGFLLGTPFPSGMRLFAGRRAAQVALIWGLNGVASVVGSLCAAMGAKLFGFNAMLACGAAVYFLACLLLLGMPVTEPATETPPPAERPAVV